MSTDAQPKTGADSPTTVHVSGAVPAPVNTVWSHLISDAGTEALLGAGARLGSKGESWRADHGPHGVLRSYHPLEQIRVSWHVNEDGPASLVDLHLVPDGDTTRIDIVHERLTDDEPHADLEQHWSEAIGRIASTVR